MKTKNLLPSFIALMMAVNAFAQPVIGIQRAAGGAYEDYFTCMVVTNDGGMVAGGYSYSNISGEKTADSWGRNGTPDYWIVKYNAAGNVLWDKTIGGYGDDNLRSLQQTTDGGYILGGYSQSNAGGNKTENNKGLNDYWIVKIDAVGNIQWDKTIGGSSWDYLAAIKQTADGGYIVGGNSDSQISGDKTQNSKGDLDYWVVKLNSSGNIEWDKTVGGAGREIFSELVQTTDGGYLLAGTSLSNISGDKTDNSRGGSDYWVLKLGNAGN